MKQVCEAAGFAFSELWTRPSREVVAEEDGSTKVQWEYLLKWADITYINYEAFPEARHLAGKLDDLKEDGPEAGRQIQRRSHLPPPKREIPKSTRKFHVKQGNPRKYTFYISCFV